MTASSVAPSTSPPAVVNAGSGTSTTGRVAIALVLVVLLGVGGVVGLYLTRDTAQV